MRRIEEYGLLGFLALTLICGISLHQTGTLSTSMWAAIVTVIGPTLSYASFYAFLERQLLSKDVVIVAGDEEARFAELSKDDREAVIATMLDDRYTFTVVNE